MKFRYILMTILTVVVLSTSAFAGDQNITDGPDGEVETITFETPAEVSADWFPLEAVVEHLRPIREESARLMKDKAYLESVYRDGAQKAGYVAEKTLRKVYKKVGFVAK